MKIRKLKRRIWTRQIRLVCIGLCAIAFTLTPLLTSKAGAQFFQFPAFNIPQLDRVLYANNNNSEVESRAITLDGYELFFIASPAITDNDSKPISQRVQTIQNTLQQIANSNSKRIDVTTRVDRNSSLPIISINDRYLMTVTTLDAQLQGSNVQRQASEFVGILEGALERAKQERQPEYLIRQGVTTAGIVVGAIALSYVFALWQKRLQKQQKQIEATTQEDSLITAEQTEPNPSETALRVKQQLSQRQKRNLSDLKRRLLHLGQLAVWSGGFYLILGLFPYTRWLQPWVVSAPLRLFGIFLVTYVLVRFGYLAIDSFFEAVQESQFIAPKASQRRALRIATLSRVLKSIIALVGLSTGVLVSLSVVGVDLVPLLAGAGIIGLAISFAAQSVIKDTINGFLILLEDHYAVGDVIAVGGVSGFVENINLRITQLRDSEGKLITIPNSAIGIVENLSKDWSRVDLAISVAYDTDPDRAIAVLRQLSQEMYRDRHWRTLLLEPPEVLGVDGISHAGMLIRVWIKTKPLQQWLVAREFRRRLQRSMLREGIEIGTPHQFSHVEDPIIIEGEPQNERETSMTSAQTKNGDNP
jgi:moderate conductance mechanosensitive channel